MRFSTPRATMEQLPDILDMAVGVAKDAGFPEAGMRKAQVILEELFINIVSHAYGPDSGPLEVAISVEAGMLRICCKDRGAPFNPLQQQVPDLQKRFARGLPGGAGIPLIRALADTAQYSWDRGCNVLELVVRANKTEC